MALRLLNALIVHKVVMGRVRRRGEKFPESFCCTSYTQDFNRKNKLSIRKQGTKVENAKA